MREGNAYSNLIKLIKKQGYNKDIDIVVGNVIRITPSIMIDLGEFSITNEDANFCSSFVNSSPKVNDQVLILINNNDIFVIDKVVG